MPHLTAQRLYFASLLAKGRDPESAAVKVGMDRSRGPAAAASLGWPHLGSLAQLVDDATAAMNGVDPAVVSDTMGFIARVEKLTAHPDWRVAADAQTLLADAVRLLASEKAYNEGAVAA